MSDQPQNGTSVPSPNASAEEGTRAEQLERAVEADLAGLHEELGKVRSELELRDRRIDELARAYSGLLNDQKEYRSRTEREKERVLEAERGKIALHLLQVGDEIERALASAAQDQGPLAQGVRLIHEGLAKTLASLGLERLKLVGTPFDPNLAEALDLVPTQEEANDGQIVAELTAGYRLGERVVRPARVRVARYLPAQPAAPGPNGAADAQS
ncbi:MAG: nucleotide exchange factor GrpE [Deltaproteobacteria bacterium]|nr:nucleotide exchange factor GrpE [Deltaproteobacteria bacterium]